MDGLWSHSFSFRALPERFFYFEPCLDAFFISSPVWTPSSFRALSGRLLHFEPCLDALRSDVAQVPRRNRAGAVLGSKYRGTSLIRNSAPLGTSSRLMSRALCKSSRGEHLLMSEVPCSAHTSCSEWLLPDGIVATVAPRSSITSPPRDPAVGLRLGPYDDPRGVGVSYGRGTPEGGADQNDRETMCPS